MTTGLRNSDRGPLAGGRGLADAGTRDDAVGQHRLDTALTEYAVLDTRFPRSVVNVLKSEHPLPVLKVVLAEFYPTSRFRIILAADAPKRLIGRFQRRPR